MTSRLQATEEPRSGPTSLAPQPSKRTPKVSEACNWQYPVNPAPRATGTSPGACAASAAARCGRLPERKQQRLPTELFQLLPHW